MLEKTVNSLAGMKNYLSFVLTFICIVGVLALAWFKGGGVESLLPTLLGVYIAGRTAEKTNAAWAVSKDPNCNTADFLNNKPNT